jgi:NADPH:quinone reductase-like Zn-dependent oxidoreductase
MTSVGSAEQAAAAALAGAQLVDAGSDQSLVDAIRQAGIDVLICGPDADLSRDARTALRTGGRLLCYGLAAAEQAGLPPERILVQVRPGEVEATARAGWQTLVDVDADPGAAAHPGAPALAGALANGGAAARAGAVASVCLWLGASVISTRHVTQVRRCLDMTESIRGTRPPAWAVRGLA